MNEPKAPSEKQIKLADEIADCLGLDFPRGSYDFTSQIYWKFIQNHIQEYKDLLSAGEESRYDEFDYALWPDEGECC